MCAKCRADSTLCSPAGPMTEVDQQYLLVVVLGGVKSPSDVGEILRSALKEASPKAGRSDKQNALGQPSCGEGLSGGVGVFGRCVILWGRRGHWRLVSHGEGIFCGTFKAGK